MLLAGGRLRRVAVRAPASSPPVTSWSRRVADAARPLLRGVVVCFLPGRTDLVGGDGGGGSLCSKSRRARAAVSSSSSLLLLWACCARRGACILTVAGPGTDFLHDKPGLLDAQARCPGPNKNAAAGVLAVTCRPTPTTKRRRSSKFPRWDKRQDDWRGVTGGEASIWGAWPL